MVSDLIGARYPRKASIFAGREIPTQASVSGRDCTGAASGGMTADLRSGKLKK